MLWISPHYTRIATAATATAVCRYFTITTLTKKNFIASLLKFAAYIHNHKILPGNIFGFILKNKMAAMGISLSVMKRANISLIIGPRVLGW